MPDSTWQDHYNMAYNMMAGKGAAVEEIQGAASKSYAMHLRSSEQDIPGWLQEHLDETKELLEAKAKAANAPPPQLASRANAK